MEQQTVCLYRYRTTGWYKPKGADVLKVTLAEDMGFAALAGRMGLDPFALWICPKCGKAKECRKQPPAKARGFLAF